MTLWSFAGTALVFAFAGIGLKWAIDRAFPAPVTEQPRHAAPPERTEARKILEFDDTMDVIGAALEQGQRSERARLGLGPVPVRVNRPHHIRPQLELVPEDYPPPPAAVLDAVDDDGDELPPPLGPPGVAQPGGGWISGPCIIPAQPAGDSA